MSNSSRMMQMAASGAPGDEWTLNSVEKPFAPLGQVYLGAAEYEQVAWQSDGSYYFVVRRAGFVHRYAGTAAWETYPATFSGSVNISSQDTEMCGLAFKSDGTKMYTTGQVNSKIYEYDLSTAWDVTTASFVQDYSLGFGSDLPTSIVFSSDGLNMFVSRNGATDAVYSYSLSSAWEISTASAVTSKVISNAWGIAFDSAGTTLVVAVSSLRSYNVYALGTAWDLTTATLSYAYNDSAWYTNGGASSPDLSKQTRHVSFKSDGTKAFLLTADTTTGGPAGLFNYDLPSAYDLFTASRQIAAANYYEFPGLNTTGNNGKAGLCFSGNGSSFYIADSFTSTIQQYDMSVPWDISTASYVAQISSAFDRDVAISRDGTLLFAALGSSVEMYTLGTAYDVTTAALTSTTNLSVFLTGIFFRDDGLKFYACYNDAFYQWTLGTAYDLSTASYDGTSATTGGSYSLRINNAGNKLLVLDSFYGSSFYLREYSLSTPWDVTTGVSLVQSYDITIDRGGSINNSFQGMGVAPDGSSVFVPIRGQDLMVQYKLK